MKDKRTAILLAALSVVLLSIPWLVPHTGPVALVALVPLLMLEQMASSGQLRHFWWWQYATFVGWNAATTFWVCNATVGGGIFAIFANALFQAIIFQIFHVSRKRLKSVAPYILLVSLWIAWERLYFNVQVSWPWLTLGNAFAQSTTLVQWYDTLGTLGGSLWIWLSNLALLAAITRAREARKALPAGLAVFALVAAAPIVWSEVKYSSAPAHSEGSVSVVIGQPNFDPYQKFKSMSQQQQNDVIVELFCAPQAKDSSLYIAPETFTSGFRLDGHGYITNTTWNDLVGFLRTQRPASEVLFGASTHEFVQSSDCPSPKARHYADDIWYLNYNSAIKVDSSSATEIFHKSKLVVGVELTPWPEVLTKLDDALGGVMGRCSDQPEISLLHFKDIPFGCAICYESVYGDYCRDYVRKGAKFLTVITNDAWWGDTPGYRQHFSYSRLRAIELGREIARCGNTGISGFIDTKGNVLSRGKWWERQVLTGEVQLHSGITPFVKYGDVVGRLCSFLAMLMLALFFVGNRRKIE